MEVIFEDCNLSGVNFSGAIIKHGEFKNGLLVGGNFEKTDLSGWILQVAHAKSEFLPC